MCPLVKPKNASLLTLEKQKKKKMQNTVKIAKDKLKLGDVPKSHNPSVLNENHLD